MWSTEAVDLERARRAELAAVVPGIDGGQVARAFAAAVESGLPHGARGKSMWTPLAAGVLCPGKTCGHGFVVLWQGTRLYTELSGVVEDIVGERPNVDFALAALTKVHRLPPEAPLILFALSRCTGWLAHALEQVTTGIRYGLVRGTLGRRCVEGRICVRAAG